ncbi:MAG: hypothetical protein JRJ69_18015 [Deltaproteobacteria bacterium]|nr:hypothetical protein [Deltaproteobacteria bacterium]
MPSNSGMRHIIPFPAQTGRNNIKNIKVIINRQDSRLFAMPFHAFCSILKSFNPWDGLLEASPVR